MKIVMTLGGNALLERGEVMSAENQARNIAKAVEAIKAVAQSHDLILSHGNGPQVGLIALQNLAYDKTPPYPLDVLGAQSQAMVGYLFMQALQNALPDKTVVNLVTRTLVDEKDPAFLNPTKFIGPVYDEATAYRLAEEHRWTVKPDGGRWRRVVPSPKPVRILESDTIRALSESGVMVIAAGGGGVPVIHTEEGFIGQEAVIDKDFAGSMLAQTLEADLFVIATDVEGVIDGWGTPDAALITQATVGEMRQMAFPAGSMGPKVDAACAFVQATGRPAVIGPLKNILGMVEGSAGTRIVSGFG